MQPYSSASPSSHAELSDAEHHSADQRATPSSTPTSFATSAVTRRTRFFLHMREMFCTIDRAGALVDANPACAEGLRASVEALRGVRLVDLLAEADRSAARQALANLAAGADEVSFGAQLAGARGGGRRLLWRLSADHEAGLAHAVLREVGMSNREDISVASGPYDLMTGLLNRFSFANQIARLITGDGRGQGFALCVIDLDHFSRINDSLGHLAGDDVLAMVADRLRQAIGPADTLARMGGDEFALIVPGADGPAATRAARCLLAALDEPLYAGGLELYVSASAGISLYPRDGADATTLLKHADSAMYRAKAGGPNSVSRYEPALGRATRARFDLDNQLRRAIDRGQFLLHYQPQIELRRGSIIAVESLIRWQHPGRGLIHPHEFIAAAEEHHLMPRIADWVLTESCCQAAAWQREGRPPVRMAVNLSARQFEYGDIVQRVRSALDASGLDPCCLDLEITESMLMHDPDGSARRIHELRALGVRVTLDDFGTGYSSLTYLQRFPVDALKVDRSFVAGFGPCAGNRANGTALVQAIVGLAHSLDLAVLAEGVETWDQHMLLRAIGCDEAQGYLYARPLPPDELWAAAAALPH